MLHESWILGPIRKQGGSMYHAQIISSKERRLEKGNEGLIGKWSLSFTEESYEVHHRR